MAKLCLRSFLFCFVALCGFFTAASAQIEGEDEDSINMAFAAIMGSMPREGDIIMSPFVSMLSTFGEKVQSQEMIDDPDVPGYKALRVTAKSGRNNWDASVNSPIGPAVKKGDLLVMVNYLRLVEGSAEMPYNVIQRNSPPFNAVIQGSETITGEWEVYVMQGKADKDYAQNSLGVSMHLANADHTVDFGPVFVFNLGQ